MLDFISGFGTQIIGVIALIAGAVAALFAAKSSGVRQQKRKQIIEDLQAKIETKEKVDEVQPSTDVARGRDRLRTRKKR